MRSTQDRLSLLGMGLAVYMDGELTQCQPQANAVKLSKHYHKGRNTVSTAERQVAKDG